jgi:hypothetical protein
VYDIIAERIIKGEPINAFSLYTDICNATAGIPANQKNVPGKSTIPRIVNTIKERLESQQSKHKLILGKPSRKERRKQYTYRTPTRK